MKLLGKIKLLQLLRLVVLVGAVGLIFLGLESVLLADGWDGGEMTLRSISGDRSLESGNAERIAVLILWIMVAIIVLIGIVSSSASWTSEKLAGLGKGPDASNLFLGVEFFAGSDRSNQFSGYLRSLGLREATFVSPTVFPRGAGISFNLRSLPGYSGEKGLINGEVLRCRSMGGTPQHYLIKVRFSKMNDGERSNLSKYVATLAAHRTAYNQA